MAVRFCFPGGLLDGRFQYLFCCLHPGEDALKLSGWQGICGELPGIWQGICAAPWVLGEPGSFWCPPSHTLLSPNSEAPW